MARDLIQEGLTVFQSGDIIGATRLWLTARQENPADGRAAAYIENVRNLIPDVVAALETELQVEASPATLVNLPLDAELPPSLDEPAATLPLPIPVPMPPIVEPVAVPAWVAAPLQEFAPGQSGASASSAPSGAAAASLAAQALPPEDSMSALAPPLPPVPPALAVGVDPWGGDVDTVLVTKSAPGLELVGGADSGFDPGASRGDLEPQRRRLRELLELDDFSGALDIAEQILAVDAADSDAKAARERCRERLTAMHVARLGGLDRVPRVQVAPSQVIWLDLDHRAGFVLAQVDGVSTFEEIIEVTGMERLMSLKILAELYTKGVIGT